MTNERHIICGGQSVKELQLGGAEALRISLHDKNANVTLKVADLTKNLIANIPDAFLDLIEIATYVYVADQAVKRGTNKLDDMSPLWRRKLIFDVPVRELDLWSSDAIRMELQKTLGFLSDDNYDFRFHQFKNSPKSDQYFPFTESSAYRPPERVVLFSGGLDSLAGAIQEVVVGNDPICLLTHEPSGKFRPRQQLLRDQLDMRASGPAPLHVTVQVNKEKELGKEYTQRSRSFLYASLAATVAKMSGLNSVRFYENGVVSINLPVAEDVVGGRATRSTHPYVLNGFSRLFSMIAASTGDSEFIVENGFVDKTKADVVRMIVENDCSAMIETSTSCTHTWTWSKLHTHCGVCSQCIDRRFAVLAAGAGEYDPAARYKDDLFLSPRPKTEDRRMISCYVETARQLSGMSQSDFAESFGQVFRVAKQLPGSVDGNIRMIHQLLQRHGKEVTGVVSGALAQHSELILNRSLPANSLLQMVHDLSIPADGMVCAVSEVDDLGEDKDDSAKFLFRKKEDIWSYRFNKPGPNFKLLSPSKGASYLHVLLANPGKVYSVAGLVLEVAKAPEMYHSLSADQGEDVLDDQAKQQLWSEYQDLGTRIEDAERNGREGEARLLRDEQQEFMDVLNNAGYKGQSKRLGDNSERHRKSFSNAIRRVREDIQKFDEDFAAHIKQYVRCGKTPCYQPPDGVDWLTF